MTTKDIHIAIKNGKGTQFMMERYGFSDHEALCRAIRGLTPSGAKGFINSLEKNQKKIDKKKQSNTTTETQTVQEPSVCTNNEEGVFEDDSSENLNVQFSDDDEEKSAGTEVKLEQLEADERELSYTLCKLEGEHKQIVAQRRECLQRLEKSKKALLELQRLLSEQEKNVTQTFEEYSRLATEMNVINEECNSYRELLDDVRQQIAELKKVSILFYANGDIEVVNAEIPSISEVAIAQEFRKLISLPEAEEFTVKVLKAIAKLKVMVKAYEEDNCAFELVFDSLEVQNFYKTVIA